MRQLMVTPTFVFSVTVLTAAVLAFATTQTSLNLRSTGPMTGCAVTDCLTPGTGAGAAHPTQAGAVPEGAGRATQPSAAPRQPGPAGVVNPFALVSVGYQTLDAGPWGFTGVIAVTSLAGRPIRQWQLSLEDRGVRITWIWGATWRPGRAGALLIEADPADGPLVPGQTLRIFFFATGEPATPSGCVFNQLPCQVHGIAAALSNGQSPPQR